MEKEEAMNLHNRALVPIHADGVHGPDARILGSQVDIGLMCEALIYYDQVLINLGDPMKFHQFVKWFVKRNLLPELILLLQEKTIVFYDYAFLTAPINKDGTSFLVNLVETTQNNPRSFIDRYLLRDETRRLFVNPSRFDSFVAAASDGLIEMSADEFGRNIDGASEDFHDLKRNAFIVQTLVDKIAPLVNIKPPKIEVGVVKSGDKRTFTYNFDFTQLEKASTIKGFFGTHTPMYAAAAVQKYLFTSLRDNCDLFLGSPISEITGDKLYESSSRVQKIQGMIDKLSMEVEFPRVRELVNKNDLRLGHILEIRKKSGRFRKWVQAETEKDRNEIIAYHSEVAKNQGFLSASKRSLEIFGAIGGAAIGAKMAPGYGEVTGAVTGAALGSISQFTAGLINGWKPYVFGEWYKSRIKKYLGENIGE